MHNQPHTEESKNKISLAKKGQVFGHKWKKGQIAWNKGRKIPQSELVNLKNKGFGLYTDKYCPKVET